MEWQYL
jgi:hypothetical protein